MSNKQIKIETENRNCLSSPVENFVMRLQRTRKKGWKKPENSVYVGRRSKWGNPYKVIHNEVFFFHPYYKEWVAVATYYDNKMAMENMLRRYEEKILTKEFIKEIKKELKGKHLLCWCKLGDPCHADILLKVANA